MKIKIDDFLHTLGVICLENCDNCFHCPLSVEPPIGGEHFYGCAKDKLEYERCSKHLKKVVLERMKGEHD